MFYIHKKINLCLIHNSFRNRKVLNSVLTGFLSKNCLPKNLTYVFKIGNPKLFLNSDYLNIQINLPIN